MKLSVVVVSLLPALGLSTSVGYRDLDPENWTLQARDFSPSEYQTLPQCGRHCVDTVTADNNCAPYNATCFCSDKNITASFDTCIQTACMPPTDMLAAQKYQADTCNYPVRSKQTTHRGVLWATFTLATLFVAFRTLSRMPALSGSGYSWDDQVVFFSYALTVMIAIATEFTLKNGSALDEYTLTAHQIKEYMIWTYVSEVLYNTVIITTKIAVLLLYLRIWSVDKITKAFRIASWAIIGVLIATCIAFDFALIFQCVPVSSTWNYITGEMGKCVNLPALTYTFGALSVVYDVIVFFLPIHSLLKLKISWQRKVGVCAVFLVGFVVTICTIVRLQYLVRFSSRKNITWNYQPVSMWSIIEGNLSVVCTCMPASAGLFQRFYRYCTGQPVSVASGHVARQQNFSGRSGTTATAVEAEDEYNYSNEKFEATRMDSAQASSPKTSDSEKTRTDAVDCETALAQGEIDGRERAEREGPGKVTEVSAPNAPRDVRDALASENTPGSTGLIYQANSGNRQNKVEIHHNPPSRPAETQLQYRDRDDVMHQVKVVDIPQNRVPRPPVPHRNPDRPSSSRAESGLNEVEVVDVPR